MAREFTDLNALSKAVVEQFTTPIIVGVDGWTGVGKTTLAKALADRVNGSSYDLDSALTRDLRRFTPAIRPNEVAQALHQPERLMFVSGICLRQVLEDAGCIAAAHIYVKRMAIWGWADEDELVGGAIPEVPGASGELIREELRAYHQLWRPHLLADFEFQRFG